MSASSAACRGRRSASRAATLRRGQPAKPTGGTTDNSNAPDRRRAEIPNCGVEQ